MTGLMEAFGSEIVWKSNTWPGTSVSAATENPGSGGANGRAASSPVSSGMSKSASNRLVNEFATSVLSIRMNHSRFPFLNDPVVAFGTDVFDQFALSTTTVFLSITRNFWWQTVNTFRL